MGPQRKLGIPWRSGPMAIFHRSRREQGNFMGFLRVHGGGWWSGGQWKTINTKTLNYLDFETQQSRLLCQQKLFQPVSRAVHRTHLRQLDGMYRRVLYPSPFHVRAEIWRDGWWDGWHPSIPVTWTAIWMVQMAILWEVFKLLAYHTIKASTTTLTLTVSPPIPLHWARRVTIIL